MKITTIAFDGDDTLWHHENYFAKAKLQYQKIMDNQGNFPDAGERAWAQHVNDLPLWGYGVKSLTLSMVGAAVKMTDGRINGNAIQDILQIGRSLYQHPIILLGHVATTVQALHGRYRLFIITKGDLMAQEMKISQSKLAPFFEATEIVSEKDVSTYTRLFNRNNIDPTELLMVGNSVKSDILPVVELGAQAVHIPYELTWEHEVAEIQDHYRDKYITLPHMGHLLEVINTLEQLGSDHITATLRSESSES